MGRALSAVGFQVRFRGKSIDLVGRSRIHYYFVTTNYLLITLQSQVALVHHVSVDQESAMLGTTTPQFTGVLGVPRNVLPHHHLPLFPHLPPHPRRQVVSLTTDRRLTHATPLPHLRLPNSMRMMTMTQMSTEKSWLEVVPQPLPAS